MAKYTDFRVNNGEGSVIIPVSDGDIFTPELDGGEFNYGQVYFEFFSDAGATIPVTPGAGTIVVQGSPMGNIFLPGADAETVNASDVSSPDATYFPPVFTGGVKRLKMTLSGITVATYMRATFWQTNR